MYGIVISHLYLSTYNAMNVLLQLNYVTVSLHVFFRVLASNWLVLTVNFCGSGRLRLIACCLASLHFSFIVLCHASSDLSCLVLVDTQQEQKNEIIASVQGASCHQALITVFRDWHGTRATIHSVAEQLVSELAFFSVHTRKWMIYRRSGVVGGQ